ncbi:patatin-like phospholipase family protein [Agromyces sp. NPDC057865]|uniref:patatin-like phospholipase family protein n=1 Tax=Agromyces sp. NPDC057865 TaxID=3346267 RepID=UPI00367287E8
MTPSSQRHAEPTSDDVSAHPTRTALVLGGGGSTGNAWLIGVLAGLFEAGVDVTDADLTIGTSAGSTAAAQVAGATPTELFAAILTAEPLLDTGRGRPPQPRGSVGSVTDHLDRMRALIASAEDQADLRRKVGARALELEAASGGSRQSQWRATVASRLPSPEWPRRRILITAVDAETGEPVAFDRESGVDLVDAVAASCSSGAAYRIGGRAYIDGGYRTNAENADLAAGYARVLVLSPFGGRSLVPASWGTHLATQLDRLRARGSGVEAIFPGSGFEHLFGANAMDPSLRPPAGRAGYDQGRALAAQIAEFWS